MVQFHYVAKTTFFQKKKTLTSKTSELALNLLQNTKDKAEREEKNVSNLY